MYIFKSWNSCAIQFVKLPFMKDAIKIPFIYLSIYNSEIIACIAFLSKLPWDIKLHRTMIDTKDIVLKTVRNILNLNE